MANPQLLTPVAGDDPCGPDLQWEPEFIGLMDAMAAAVSRDEGSVVGAEVAQSDAPTPEDVIDMAARLSVRTKDVRVLAVYAEASWRDRGLAAFANAMDDLATVLETWPGPGDGVHPRADESDGDLGERTAALARLLNRVPGLAATIGWGAETGDEAKAESSASLRRVFGTWRERLAPAFGPDLPSSTDAWRSLKDIVVAPVPHEDPHDGDPEEATGAAGAPPPALDVWDLIDRAVDGMSRQDRHSPALPILQLLASWRALDLVEIADSMKASGVALEQLLESVKKQTRPSK